MGECPEQRLILDLAEAHEKLRRIAEVAVHYRERQVHALDYLPEGAIPGCFPGSTYRMAEAARDKEVADRILIALGRANEVRE